MRWHAASICKECWNGKNPDVEPARVLSSLEEECCFCRKLTKDGIYVREDALEISCRHKNE